MKVLHIIDSGGLYGAEVMLLNLAMEQIRIGLDPVICSIGEKGIGEKPLETEAIKRGIKIKIFRMTPGPNIMGAFKILKFAEKEKFDILHSHGYKGNVLFGFILKAFHRIPLIATVHGWTTATSNRLSKMKLYEWLDAKSLKYIDRVVLVNKEMFSNPMIRSKNLQNFTVINNGIPSLTEKSSKDMDKEIIEFCQEGFVVGSIGRLSYEKGFNFLIEVVARLSLEIREIKLVIIGEGRERKILEEMVVSLGLKEKVLMPGYRDTADMYLSLFNVFVIPSLTEGLPMVLLEAMQYGIPVVATSVGGIPDVLEDGKDGLLVQPGESDMIATSLRKVYKKELDLATMVKRAKDKVLNNYSSERMAREYKRIYEAAKIS